MKYFIGEKQLKTNFSKFGITTFDEEAVQTINKFQLKKFEELAKNTQKQQKKAKRQNGGRISMPIQYFTGQQASGVDATSPSVSSTETMLRPETLMNDPTGVLGTDKAMHGLVGGAKRFELSKSAAQNASKQALSGIQLDGKQQFIRASKQKFEDVLTDVLGKMQKRGSHLCDKQLQQVLSLKKYQNLKF